MSAVITLTTDFGVSGSYITRMKGDVVTVSRR